MKAQQAMMQEQQCIADLLQYIGALTQEGYTIEAIKRTQELLASLHSIKRLEKEQRLHALVRELTAQGINAEIAIRGDLTCL